MNDELVLIFDFGSQYGQLIARRVREQNVFCQIVRHDLPAARVARAEPEGDHPLRRPGERLRARRPAAATRRSSTSASPSSASATACSSPARSSAARSAGPSRREFGRATAPRHRRRRASSPACPTRDDRLDEPRRPGAGGHRRLRAAGRDRHLPGRRGAAPHAAGLRPAVPPRGQPHAARRPDPARTSSTTSAAARACGRCRRSSTRRSPSVRRAGRQATASSAGCPAASIRRSCAALLLQGDRPAGGVHLRRQRPAARGRDRDASAHTFRDYFKADLHVVDARERFLTALDGRHRPAGEAEDHRPRLHRRVQGRGASRIPDAQFLAQGTLYPDVIESGGAADGPAATIKRTTTSAACRRSSASS